MKKDHLLQSVVSLILNFEQIEQVQIFKNSKLFHGNVKFGGKKEGLILALIVNPCENEKLKP